MSNVFFKPTATSDTAFIKDTSTSTYIYFDWVSNGTDILSSVKHNWRNIFRVLFTKCSVLKNMTNKITIKLIKKLKNLILIKKITKLIKIKSKNYYIIKLLRGKRKYFKLNENSLFKGTILLWTLSSPEWLDLIESHFLT